MSDYLTYTLWRQREERMPRELEHQRVVQERLREQEQDRRFEQLATSAALETTGVDELADVSADAYALVEE